MFSRMIVQTIFPIILWANISNAQHAPVFQARTLLELPEPIWGLKQIQTQLPSIQQPLALLTNPGRVLLIDPAVGQYQELYTGGNSIQFMSDRPTIDAGFITDSNTQDIVFSDAKKIVVLTPTTDGWSSHVLFDISEMVGVIWGARVGDLVNSNPGEEILGIIEGVFDSSFANVYQFDGSQWSEKMVYQAEVGMDSTIGDIDSERDGEEFVIVTEMGPTYTLHEPAAGWEPSMNPPIDGFWGQVHWPIAKISDDIENAGWVVEIGDVDSDVPGNEIVYGNRYNNKISLLTNSPDGGYIFQQIFKGNWVEETIEPLAVIQNELTNEQTSPGNIWDIALGDVLPDIPGLEIVGVDDSGSVYLVWKENGQWHGETIYQSIAPLFAVEVFDADLAAPGEEIVIGGQAKEVVVLSKQTSSIENWQLLN